MDRPLAIDTRPAPIEQTAAHDCGPGRSCDLAHLVLVVAAMAWRTMALALAFLAGCTFSRNLDYLERGEREDESGTEPSVKVDAPPTLPDRVTATPPACEPGTILKPVRAYVFGTEGTACDAENALLDDGKVAGLDRASEGGRTYIESELVGGCIAIEFDAKVPLQEIALKLGRVADGCGLTPCVGDGCGAAVGDQAFVFAGERAEIGSLRFVKQVKYGNGALSVLHARVDEAAPNAHAVVVCRPGTPNVDKDDVGVDAVWGECL